MGGGAGHGEGLERGGAVYGDGEAVVVIRERLWEMVL